MADEPLPQRVLCPQRLEFADQFARTTELQVRADPVLECGDPQFGQPDDLRSGEVVVRELLERVAAPLAQRRGQQPGGFGRVIAKQLASASGIALEPTGVHGVVVHRQ